MNCLFCENKDVKEPTFVHEFENWVLRLSPYQFLLGVCMLIHKDHKEGLTSLSENEIVEMYNHLKTIESALRRSFSPDWFNYLQTNNSIRHFHLHIIPRYKNPVTFQNEVFEDNTFTSMPEESKRQLSDSNMSEIIKTIQKNI